MISESIKKKLDTLKSPENSQTNQSGFSASGMDKLTALKEELNRPVTPYEPKFDESLVESGKTKYESDKSQFQSAYGKWNRNVMGVASANWGKTGKAVEGLPDNRTGWEGVSDRYTADMDEDTLKSFYTLYDKDADSAIDFASEYQRLKAEQKAVENAQKTDETFKKLGLINDDMPESAQEIAKNVAKTMIGIGGMAFTPIDAASALIDYSAGGGNFSEDVKAGNAMPFTQMSSQFQNEVRQAIAQDAKWAETKEGGFFREKLGIENFATAMFDVGYSSAQSALIMKTFGPAGLALFGTSAFSSSLQENLARDKNGEPLMDDGTALAKATIAGALEAITEKVSLEHVLTAKNSKGAITKIRNLIFAGLAEGSEELASEVGNYVTDALLRADASDFAKAKAKYLADGEDDDTAAWHAILEFMPEAAYSTLSGFFSGLLMQGFAMSLQDVAANANARSTIAESKATGEYADLIEGLNASDYMKGKTPLTEASKKRDVVKAYRGATESIEQASIKDRLMEETTYAFEGDAEATAKAIYDKANGYALSAAQKRLLGSQAAQKVLTEYTEGKKKSGTHEWVDTAANAQEYATSKSTPEITSLGIEYLGEQTLAREAETQREAKAAEDARIAEYRKEQLAPYADKYGLDIADILDQHSDITTGAYRKAIQDSFNLASAGYTLEQVQKTVQLPMEGVLLKAYNNGVTAYAKSKGAAPTQRVNIRSNAKIELASESDVARNAPNAPYKAVNLNEVKTKKPKVYAGMLFLSKFVAPRINRKIVFFDGGANTGGWRTADSIGINIGGSFELYRKTGNVVGLFMHEFGHDLRADSQELYDELRQIIINDVYKGDAARFDAEVRAEMSSRATVKSQFGEGAELDYINAEEEIIGNALAKIAESPESLERVFAENKGKQSIQKLFDMLKKLIGDIKEFFASFGHANSIADIIDEDALSKIEGVLQRYVEQIDNTPVGRIAESLPTDTTEITDVADATKYSIASFAEGCGFKIDPETHAWQLKFPATRVTPTDIRNSPIGALIMFSKEMGDIGERGGITEKEANDQIQMFTDIANMCIESADFSMTMQFVGSSMFTGLKANADKQYGTTFDFPSICTKTQAVIDAMSREMVRKQGGLTKEEIAVIYTKVWFDNNPVPCPECYVFSRWVGIGGLLDNIWHFQNIYSKMTPEQVRAEYKKYDAIFAKQVEELNAKKKSGDKVLTKNQIKNEQKKKYDKEYASLVEKQQKAQDGGAPFTEADEARLKEITPIYDTLRSMTYIQKVYFADDKMAVVNKNAFVPAEVLFDLNNGEDFAKKYPEAWAFRTTQGAIYGKAITPYAEEVLGEGIIGAVNVTKQANAKAKFGRETSDNITERKSNPFLESKGELTADARKTLMTARKKQLNQAYIGGQRFQSISDARYENFLDYLIAALEVQAMGGMVQMYTKVSGAVEATNAWGFSNNQSLMPKGGGIVNGVIQDTAHGGMRPSVAFENRQKFEYAGTITIGVNDEHIRAMFGDVNRDFIIPYHASGGDRLLIAAMRATLDPDANVVQSTDYTKEQSEKILNDSLLDDPADVHKFREQRLAILTRKGNLDMDYINAPGNELLRRVYDSVNSGIYEGATVAKGVCEAQIFPNEYWDTSLSYEESGKIVEDYLEYCRRLGFLHKFSGKTQTYDRKTNAYKLTQLNGRDAQGKEVPLTDLAYKNGNPEDGVEPYYWKVLVDRRMYGNNGQYLQQRTIKVTADTAKYATTFAGGKENQNAGSVRAYSKEKSDKTLSWVDKGGVRDSVMALKDKGIELKSLPLRGEEVSKLFAPKTKSELQTKWSTRRYFEDSDAQKLASENPLINAIFETIKSSVNNIASGKFLEDVYREHPELNFTGRIQENPKGEATERFRNLVNSINDVELIDDIRWFVPEFHRKLYDDNGVFMGRDYSYAQKHSKAIKLIRQICDERIESLKDAGGTNLGVKTGTAFDVKDIRNLFESWNTHAELNDLANKVFDLAERLNIAVVAVNDKNASLGDYANLGYWHGNASRYGTGKTGLVAYQLPVFNAKTISNDSKAQIILHEMIHACTANILHAVQLLDLTQEQVDAIQPYVNLINEGMYHLKTNQKWTPSTPNMYGMKNIHEFLAELSNPEFRKALASVDDESIKEVLVYEQTLRPWINATNLETYSVSVLEKLLSDFSMEVYTEFSNRRKYRVKSDTPKYSVRKVPAIQPSSGAWARTHTVAEAMKIAASHGVEMWPVNLETNEKRNPTQVRITTSTYEKIYKYLGGNYKGRILDASSGLGDGTKLGKNLGFDVTDIEPFPDSGYVPKYQDYTALDDAVAKGEIKPYDFIISNAVLNVVPQDERDGLVVHMGHLLAPGGQMFIQVRPKSSIEDLANKPKNVKLGYGEAVESSKGSYQYGFTDDELKAYIEDALGDGYTVVNGKKTFGTSAPTVLVTKKSFDNTLPIDKKSTKYSERRVTGFYSQMGRVIEQQKADKFDARSLINMLLGKGVKAEEIKWSGLPAFLEGKKSVTKSDLMEFIEGSTLDVTEEMLSGDETRHKGYTIEGDYSDNYREFLFKWSNLGYSNDYMDLHWEKPNVLAHARVDDTKDAEGNDVLFIEEIQSDWHNAAATAKGYMSADDFEKKKKIRQPISYFEDWLGDAHWAYGSKKQNSGPRIDEFNVKMKEFGAPWRIMFDHGAYNLREGNVAVLKGETWGGFLDELWDVDFTDYEEVGNELYGTMPPEAPFKNNKYTDFVVKNMLHRAAEEGYEKIAWTTAKTQSDRWSDEYSKAYEIEYDHDIPKYLEKFGKQWGVKPTHEKLENGVIAWTFPITDAMQNSVVYEGQPMYSMRRIEDHTTIKSGSLFSGGGLLEQGLEYQLLTHEFGVEYDATIAATWKENNGDGKIYAGKAEGNVFNFDGKQYKGKMFHIHASPVCHNLSPAKHGYGEQPSDIESAKKTLQIFLDAEAPVYTVENAALYAKTESARIIKEGLENAGYKVDIGVYNSADYGSAQSRTRTIIRAIRGDLMMPDRPRTLPRTRTWDQVTRDLWDGLERITENDIQEGYRNAVRKTGIDINNVKVPTLLLQTTTAGKVSYAVEGTQSPTLTTHCYDSKLLLPGGIICNVTPQFMGRLMGLPDDFKYPHWKDGTLKKTIPYKIIGNGIPVELTKAVVGGVIESAYEQTEGRSLYSIRRVNNDLSPREYLTEATLETIRSPKERAEFERLASEYRTLDDKSITLQNQIDDLNLEIDETYWKIKALEDELLKTSASNSEKVTNLIKRYGSASEALQALRSDLRDAQSKLRDLRSDLAENEEKMHDILTVPLVERIVDEQRKLTREYEELLESTKAADQQKLANLRATMGEKVQEEIDRRVEMRKNLTAKFHEREGVNYYLPRLQSALKDLNANVTKAPMPLRDPVYRFFSLFDFKTRDKEGNVRKGQANIDRQAEQDRINSLLGTGEGSIQEWLGKYNVEISEDVQTWLEDTRNFLTWMLLNKETLNVRTASAKQIQSAYHLARSLNTIIKSLSKAYTDANLDMSRIDKMAAEHADSLGIRRNAEVSGVAKLMRYEHAQPITVFDRLGDAGKAVFKLLAQGEGKRARNEQQIADFIDTWNQSDVKKWIDPKEAVEVKFQVLDEEGNPEIGEDGEEVYTSVKMTPAQMMTIYCTAKDAAGYRHLMVGGFKLADVIQTVKGRRYHVNDTIRKITETDLENLIATMNTYDENLIPFADSLQNFIDTVGTMWGNQVSIKRYGYEQFDIENYFPLITVLRNRTSDISKKAKLGELTSQIFSLINKSFTKDRLANASNPLIIQNVFDVFFEHMEDMAIYNAYALPVLDTMRFLQYTQYDEDGKEVWNLDEKLNNAYGNGVMQNYIMRLLVSINGERPMTNAENLALTALRLRNRVAVAANLRVVLQQPLSIARALEVIPAKYIRPFGHFMDTYHEMIAHSDIALKKDQGYFGADVKRSLMEKALGSGTAWYNKYYDFVNKVTEIGMKPAEAGDMLTWTTLWNACKNWVKDADPSLEGDAFFAAVDDKFTDIIYRTQVVDSVLQKSEFMRQKDFFHRSTSSFKGEPTTSYNTLLRLYDRILEAKQSGKNIAQVWSETKKPMLNAFVSYALNTLVIALATSVADAFRDDDDYETWWEKFLDALLGTRQGFIKSNLFESVNFLDLPVFSEAFALLQGYKADRVDLMFIQETIDIANSISGFIKKANWKDAMKLLGGVSMLSGLPMQNLAREVFAIWNNTIGVIDPSMKIETSPAPKSLGYDQFYTALSNENYVRATELIDEIMDNAKDANEAYQGITDKVHDAFVNGKITEAEAFDYLNLCEGYVEGVERTDKQQRNRIENWKKAMEEKGLKWKQ